MALGLTRDSSVEHEELLKIHFFWTWPVYLVPRPEEPKSVYVGGDYHCHGESGKTHFALAFEAPGGWLKEKESNQAIVLTVLQAMWEDNKTRSKWVFVNRCYFPNDLPEADGHPCSPESNEVYESNHATP